MRLGVTATLLLFTGLVEFMVYVQFAQPQTDAMRTAAVKRAKAPRILHTAAEGTEKSIGAVLERRPTADLPADKLRAAAQQGDVAAQNELGARYLAGRHFDKDEAKAAKWFERAALRGLASAQFNLATLHHEGRGLKPDTGRAVFWYLSAAEQGHVQAQHNLATIYAADDAKSTTLADAIKWFARAAAAGLPDSQFRLGEMYENGRGIGSDAPLALAWYSRAARNGHREARRSARRLAALGFVAKRLDGRAAAAAEIAGPIERKGISEIQRLLARLDFKPGPADGSMGGRTKKAIRLYQQLAGRKVDGKPSSNLLEDLRAAVGTMDTPSR